MTKKDPIQLVDVSARDGLQNEPNAETLTAQDKVEYILRLAATGLSRIEAGSFVKPSAVPAMANSGEVAEKLQKVQGQFPHLTFSYLVPNLKGLERAIAVGAKEVAVFLALSERFARYNINATSVNQSFKDIEPVIDEAISAHIRVRGYLSTVFGYSDQPFNAAEAANRAAQMLEMGCFEVSLGDTTGIAKPGPVGEVIAALERHDVPLSHIAMHFHDTFGNAIINVAKSYELGIRIFDASTGGLGGCPYANSPKGNLAMETLVKWCIDNGVECSVKDPKALETASKFILGKLGKTA